MNNFIKKMLGIDKIEQQISIETQRKLSEIEEQITAASKLKLAAEETAQEAVRAAISAKEQERLAKLSPKELANEKKEPWVGVLETHVNKENIKHGFFDLDWNEYFVLELRSAGYKGTTDEEVVDQWFSDLCRHVALETYELDQQQNEWVRRRDLGNGRTEVS